MERRVTVVNSKTPGRLARKLFPRSGRAYELFDCSVLLLVLGFFGYVVNPTTTGSRQALVDIFEYVPQELFGLIVSAAALYGIIASYTRKMINRGYAVVTAAAIFVSGVYVAGAALVQFDYRTIVSIVVYGWVARRLIREEGRDYCQYCFMDWEPDHKIVPDQEKTEAHGD